MMTEWQPESQIMWLILGIGAAVEILAILGWLGYRLRFKPHLDSLAKHAELVNAIERTAEDLRRGDRPGRTVLIPDGVRIEYLGAGKYSVRPDKDGTGVVAKVVAFNSANQKPDPFAEYLHDAEFMDLDLFLEKWRGRKKPKRPEPTFWGLDRKLVDSCESAVYHANNEKANAFGYTTLTPLEREVFSKDPSFMFRYSLNRRYMGQLVNIRPSNCVHGDKLSCVCCFFK